MIVIDIVIWADLEAAAAGEAAWLAPEWPVKVDDLLPRRVRDVHVKTPDVSNIDMDWWSDLDSSNHLPESHKYLVQQFEPSLAL